MDRRRMLLQMAKQEQYVTNGLVLWLDGLNRGGVAGKWHDLIGTEVATLTGEYAELTDGVDFYSGNGYGVFTSSHKINYLNGSIEFAVELTAVETTGRPVCCIGGNYEIGGTIASKSGSTGPVIRFYYQNVGVKAWTLPNSEIGQLKFTASGNNARGIINGITADAYENFSGMTPYSMYRLASRGDGNTKFKGIIHALRVYNRQLTADEMLNNQRLDNKRFNLGLTI
jgi:hypothetical protein